MSRSLRVLLIEDREDDAQLLVAHLRRRGLRCEHVRVDSSGGLRAALARGAWDVAISDYAMPGFGGLAALSIVREGDPELPFIMVSGAIDEETAARAMQAGAQDFVGKANLARLVPAIERELREARLRTDKRQVECHAARLDRFRTVVSGVAAAIATHSDCRALLAQAARVLVEKGGFAFAWFALHEQPHEPLRAVACHGRDRRSGASLAMPHDNLVRDDAAIAQALRGGTPVVTGYRAYGDGAAGAGARAILALPGGACRGLLCVHSEDARAFDAEGLRCLEEVCGELAFGLRHVRQVAQLDFIARHDAATGLPNRALFLEELASWRRGGEGAIERFAVVVLEVAQAQRMDEAFGPGAGDELLIRAARRLAGPSGRMLHVARLDAGRLGAAVAGLPAGGAGRYILERLRDCFAAPIALRGGEHYVAPRAGVALHPEDGADAALLLMKAESAAGRAAGEGVAMYEQRMTAEAARQVTLEARLRAAVARGEFELFYQPKVTLPRRRLAGVEALLRWRSPERGLVPASEFIGALEACGLMEELGPWVFAQAAEDRRRWARSGLVAPRVAVNVSAVQLRRADFIARVRDAIGPGDAGIDIEITENSAMEDRERCVRTLEALRGIGMDVALDDFGTGHSSLSCLSSLPLDTLKIDRSFIRDMGAVSRPTSMVTTIVALAHSLGLRVVAEGVEAEVQAEALWRASCDQVQGYLTGMPASWESLCEHLPAAAADAPNPP